jgi:hypothetical protein
MTNMFKPGPARGEEDTDGGRKAQVEIPPGKYLIALVWFQRKTAKSGSEYLTCKFEICAGPLAGEGFFTMVSLDTGKTVPCKRLELWMENVGRDTEIDLDSDQEIAEAFRGKAFKATLLTRRNGSYVNVEIDRFAYLRDYTDEDDAACEAWEAKRSARGWEGRDPTDPGHAPADAPAGRRSEPEFSPGSSFADDDIPF